MRAMNLFFEEDDDDNDDYADVDISYMYEEELTQTASDCSSSSSLNSLGELSPGRQQPRRSIRTTLVRALSSPVKVAKNKIANPLLSPNRSPSKKKLKMKNHSSKKLSSQDDMKTWQEKFDLPPKTTREQAMAILLCRELEMMDI